MFVFLVSLCFAFIVHATYGSTYVIRKNCTSEGAIINCSTESNKCEVHCDGDASCYKSVIYCPANVDCKIICKGTKACYHSIVLANSTSENPRCNFQLVCNGHHACNGIQLYINNTDNTKVIAKQRDSLQGHFFYFSNMDKIEIDCTQPFACGNEFIFFSFHKYINVSEINMNCIGDFSCYHMILSYEMALDASVNLFCDGELACKATMFWPDENTIKALPDQETKANISCVSNSTDISVCALELYVQEGFQSDRIHLQCNEFNDHSCLGTFYHCGMHYKNFCSMMYDDTDEWICVGSCPHLMSSTLMPATIVPTIASDINLPSTTNIIHSTPCDTAKTGNSSVHKMNAKSYDKKLLTAENTIDTSAEVSNHQVTRAAILVGIIIGVFCLGLLCGCLFMYCRRKRNKERIHGGHNYGTLRSDDPEA